MIALLMFLAVVLGLNLTAHAILVAHWNFDENTGSTANDSSGFGNEGDIYGATWVEGKYGSGLSFDGVDDYVKVFNSDSINTKKFTLSAWVSFDNLNDTQVIIDKRNGQWDRNYSLNYYPNESPGGLDGDYLAALVGDGISRPTTWDHGAYAAVSLVENKFYHLAATYDESVIRLYLEGVEIDSRNLSMNDTTGGGDLYIGAHGDLIGNYYTHGRIDMFVFMTMRLPRKKSMHLLPPSPNPPP